MNECRFYHPYEPQHFLFPRPPLISSTSKKWRPPRAPSSHWRQRDREKDTRDYQRHQHSSSRPPSQSHSAPHPATGKHGIHRQYKKLYTNCTAEHRRQQDGKRRKRVVPVRVSIKFKSKEKEKREKGWAFEGK